MVVLAFLTLEPCGFVGVGRVKSESTPKRPMTLRVKAIDPAAASALLQQQQAFLTLSIGNWHILPQRFSKSHRWPRVESSDHAKILAELVESATQLENV